MTPADFAGDRRVREPSLGDAVIPLVALVVTIGGATALFGLDAIAGPIPAALIICDMIAALVILKNGHPWRDIQASSTRALSSIAGAIFMLLAVGAMIGTWCLSGTIPTLVYYGIALLSPAWYYAAAAVICGASAMAIGSAWATAGAIGVGLVGLAPLLGVSPAVTAGAVISGAYLGDRLSPRSETTIVAAQMVEIDIRQHIRRQAWTSLPAFAIAGSLFLLLGLRAPRAAGIDTAAQLTELGQVFNITLWNLLPLLVIVAMSARRAPASLSIMAAALFAGALAMLTQPDIVRGFGGAPQDNLLLADILASWKAIAGGFSIQSGHRDIDRLFTRGGMYSMLVTLWLIAGSVTFGTLLAEFGLIKRLMDPLVRTAKGTGSLCVRVVASAFGLNIIAGDQYIALELPARTFRAEFATRGLAPTALSRLCADAGASASPLVPWNACGAFMAAVLGVPTIAYLPFCFFNVLGPVLGVLYGFTGFKIEKVPPQVAGPPDALLGAS